MAGRIPWPLMAILLTQAVLAVRLVWSNTAFGDEALYLWAGHLEIAHWLHGTRIPAFPTYFSGSPVIYPPLGALADSLGGLAAARLLSLCFMMAATCMLWAVVSHLFGRRTAFFAAALWATLASTQFLGAFATYDAMSLLLMATAAWCAIRAGEQPKAAGWLAGAAVALAAANATKYASGIFDPVIVTLTALAGADVLPWRQAVARAATLLGYVVSIFVFLLSLGGGEYVAGVTETTLARPPGTSPASTVINEAWQLTAIIVILAAAGVLLSLADRTSLPRRLMLLVAAGAALLVPVEQARIHTTFALHKHVDFGAWFAAIAAGYAIDMLIRHARFRLFQGVITGACIAVLVFPVRLGIVQAKARFHDWPNSSSLVTALHYLLPRTSGPILISTPDVSEYYLPEGSQWYRWSNLHTIRLLSGKTITSGMIGRSAGAAAYEKRIRRGFFSVVVVNLRGSYVAFNKRLLSVLEQNSEYRLAASVPYWHSQIWLRDAQPHARYHLHGPTAPLLTGLLLPVPRLSPLLGTVTSVVDVSGLATLAFTVLVRLAWRRGKEDDEI